MDAMVVVFVFLETEMHGCLVISHRLVLRFSSLIPVSIKVPFDLFLNGHFYVLQDERDETRHAAAVKETDRMG